MARTERRRRTQCALSCQILGKGRKPVEGRIASLSEGGLCVVSPLRFEEGDTIRLRMSANRSSDGVAVTGIVWNDQPATGSLAKAGFRRLGCMLSDPSKAYLKLVEQVERRTAPPLERRIPTPSIPRTHAPEAERDLPRSRVLMPPPKPEPEETLPTFRVRLKQIGGPRSRSIAVRAHSVAEAEAIAREGLTPGGPEWELIEVVLAS